MAHKKMPLWASIKLLQAYHPPSKSQEHNKKQVGGTLNKQKL